MKFERRLRVSENRVLRRIFGPKRDEVTGEWRNLPDDELNDMYPSLNIIRVIKSTRMRWSGHVTRMRMRTAYRILVGKPEGKRTMHRWEDNIKMDLQEMEWVRGLDLIVLAQDKDKWRALVNAVMNL